MGLDPDPFDDIFTDNVAKNHSRAAGVKFQPKAKRGPIRKASILPSSPSIQSLEISDSAKKGSGIALEAEKIPETYDGICLESVNHGECFTTKQSADLVGLKSPESFSSSTDKESAIPSQKSAIPASQNAEEELASPEISSSLDPLTHGQPIVSNSGDCVMHDERSESEQMEQYPCLESLDMSDLTRAGPRARKFLPKLKIHVCKGKAEASVANLDTEESRIGQLNNSSGIGYTDKEFVSAFTPNDDVLDLLSLGLDMSPFPADEQPRGLTDASHAEVSHVERIEAEMRENIGTFRPEAAFHLSPDQQSLLTSSPDNEVGRGLRVRQKRAHGFQLVDEFDHEEIGQELSADGTGGSVNTVASDKDFQVQDELPSKNRRRKSKKPVVQKEEPVRNHEKSGEAPADAAAKVPRKFSHSTRQKRRRVNKVLLETPEDEIDPQKVPIRDLTILADYKERLAKKEPATSEDHFSDQSKGEEHCNGHESPRIQEDSIYNYQTYMNKTPKIRWSKEDTDLFYKAVRQFGTALGMVHLLFPGRTEKQIKLKYKNEMKKHRAMLDEAVTSPANGCILFEQAIKRLTQISAEKQQSSSNDETIGFSDDEVAEKVPETNIQNQNIPSESR